MRTAGFAAVLLGACSTPPAPSVAHPFELVARLQAPGREVRWRPDGAEVVAIGGGSARFYDARTWSELRCAVDKQGVLAAYARTGELALQTGGVIRTGWHELRTDAFISDLSAPPTGDLLRGAATSAPRGSTRPSTPPPPPRTSSASS